MKARLYTLLAILLTASMILAACVTQPTETPPTQPSPPSAPMEEPLAATEPSTDVGDLLENTSGEPESIADDATPSDETGQESIVTLWHGMGELEILALHDIVAAFQTRYPSVYLNVLYLPFDDLYARYADAAAAGDGPDLLLGPGEWGPALYDAGLIADVTSLASPEFLSTINPAALDVVQYKGDLIGLPHSVSGVVMYRNSSIVADAPADFDALVASAQAATQGGVVGAYLERSYLFASAHIAACNGEMMNSSGDPAFNDAAGICWLNLLKSFEDAGPAEFGSNADLNLFKLGKAGIIIDGTWNLPALADTIGDNLVIDPWPAYADTHLSGYVWAENIYMNANLESSGQLAAWQFMEFILSPEAQAIMAGVDHIPAAVGVEGIDLHILQAVQALAGGIAYPVIPEMDAYGEHLDIALRSYLKADADPVETLQTAFDAITAAIEKIRTD